MVQIRGHSRSITFSEKATKVAKEFSLSVSPNFVPVLFFQPPEFLYEFAQLVREFVHGLLEAGQEVERHHDGEAYGRNGGQDGLFHDSSLLMGKAPANAGAGGREHSLFQCRFLNGADVGTLEGRGQVPAGTDGLLGYDFLGCRDDFRLGDILVRIGDGNGRGLIVFQIEYNHQRCFHGLTLLILPKNLRQCGRCCGRGSSAKH